MTANPPHPPGPGEGSRLARAEEDTGPLSGGMHGILAVTLATLALALTAAGVSGLVAWLV